MAEISESKRLWIRDQWPYDVDMKTLEPASTDLIEQHQQPQTPIQDQYADWTNEELRQHLEDFGLDKTGNKAEMKARLASAGIGPNDEPEEE